MSARYTKKLAVFGCSFSDYLPLNQTVWGRELALLQDRQYLHHGAGAGSNWRIWRELGTGVISGKITDQDLVLVQYTRLERREFWSAKQGKRHHGKTDRDPWPTGGDLLRYKAMSWQWQDNQIENDFFKQYEENFVNEHYERVWFDLQHTQLQLLLQSYNIRCIFLDARQTPVRPLSVTSPFDQWLWLEPEEFNRRTDIEYEPGDHTHFSDQGHRELALLLNDHIKKLGW
jgi:hypothetical protein